jgi:ribonuclease BN (tRNA processing enzyme)
LILDLGTGVRPLGKHLDGIYGPDEPIEVVSLLTHLHWDHLIGLPFFGPVLRHQGQMTVYGPPQEGGTLDEIIDKVVQPPFFPVQVEELRGAIDFCEVDDGKLELKDASVLVRRVEHLGTTLGFRIEAEGRSITYIPDHQAPEGRLQISDAVLELSDGTDLLIHDAQYTDEEFVDRGTWGHSTVEYAVRVASESGARNLSLFHHDPGHLDEDIDHILEHARVLPSSDSLSSVTAATEGVTIDLDLL